MGLKLRRRSVYVGTIVALLATIGGIAVAAAVGGIAFTPGTGNQNFGSLNTGPTIYSTQGTSVVVTLVLVSSDGLSAGCSTTAVYSGSSANIAVAGAGTTCPATGEWYDELTFSGVAVASSVSDTFWVAVNGASAGAPFTITSTGAITGSAQLNIYIDDGLSSAAPQITSLSVTVQGS